MKSILVKSTVFLFVALIFTSCLKTKHTVRIINHYSDDLTEVKVGSTSFGDISAGATTSYKEVPEGTSTISGMDSTDPSKQLTGSLSVTGNGKHKWSITISSSGTLSVAEDH